MNIANLSIEEKERLEDTFMRMRILYDWLKSTPNWTLLYDLALEKLNDSCFVIAGSAHNSKEIMNTVEFMKKEFDKIVLPKEEKLNSVMSELINRFGLKDEDQIAEKIQQLMDSELNNQFVNQLVQNKLIDIINSYYPEQVSDPLSALIFISEIIKKAASTKDIQNNTNVLCVNTDTLKTENDKLKYNE